MKAVFWASAALIAYAYLGYPLWLNLRRAWRGTTVRKSEFTPFVSFVIAVRNEAETLPRKLANLSAIDYPADRFEIIVVSDGSSDTTPQFLQASASDRLQFVVLSAHVGKAAALNHGVQVARGELLVFTDARQEIEPGALRQLLANFADPAVGCVSGELVLGSGDSAGHHEGVGLYWRMEKKIREWEAASGSVIGATGAFYAVRKCLVPILPPGTILDDVYIPLNVVRQGARVLFEPAARAHDRLPQHAEREFQRKVRTLTGNYQLLQLAPWLLTRANPVRFEFVSHKLIRLIVPFALLGALISSAMLQEPFYRIALVMQLAFYASATLSLAGQRLGWFGRIGRVAYSFLLLNSAAVVALVNFLTGKKQVWVR
jgi:cellulose synthase/poly-beta-1,6-N-acetylglucosamine synthase-like glycosyltransferase